MKTEFEIDIEMKIARLENEHCWHLNEVRIHREKAQELGDEVIRLRAMLYDLRVEPARVAD